MKELVERKKNEGIGERREGYRKSGDGWVL
jgi:hypothetical protein